MINGLMNNVLMGSLVSSSLVLMLIGLRKILIKYASAQWYYNLWFTVLIPWLVICLPINFSNSKYTVVRDLHAISRPLTLTLSKIAQSTNMMEWLFLLFWLTGATITFSYFIFLHLRSSSMIKRNARLLTAKEQALFRGMVENKNISIIRVSSVIESPMLCHLVRPKIYLPVNYFTDFSAHEQKYMLLHEIAHYERCDLFANVALLIMSCLNWFNPVLWLTYKNFRIAQEVSCDAVVSKSFSSDEKKSYGYALLKIVEQHSTQISVMSCSWGARNQLKERFIMLKFHNARKGKSFLGMAIFVMGSCAAIAAPAMSKYDYIYSGAGMRLQADMIRSISSGSASMLEGHVRVDLDNGMKLSGDKVMAQYKNDRQHKIESFTVYGKGFLEDGGHSVEFINGTYEVTQSQLMAEQIIERK